MTQPTHPATPEERGLHALRVYRQKGSYEKTRLELGLSKKRAHELVKRGLKVEMERAKAHEEGSPTDA